MTSLPRKLNSSDPFAVAFNRLLQCIEERTPKSSNTVKVRQRQMGFTMDAQPPATAGVPGKFRGEYSGLEDYAAGESVKISNGVEAGHYLAVQAVPGVGPTEEQPHVPWAGGRWVLLGRMNDQSSWL